METKMTYNNGMISLYGSITREQTTSLFQKLHVCMTLKGKMVICLDQIKQIDFTAVQAFKAFYRTAMQQNKIVAIIGKANTVVNDKFGRDNYILRHDFI